MEETVASRTMSKVTRRFLPILFICFVISFLDRINIGFAALSMNKALGLSAAEFGLGAGLFFVTYVFAEVPSNLALERFGARLWIARIMLTWGLLSAATAFVQGPLSFYTVRLLLGAAEAGFFPGVIFFLTRWVPPSYRGLFVGSFMAAMPVASVIGGPVSSLLLGLDHTLGLQGWQWLFVIEAVPAILMAPVVWLVLTDKPEQSAWLEPEEKAWLLRSIAGEETPPHVAAHPSIWQTIVDPKVLVLSLAWFGLTGVNYGLSFFLPQIISAFGTSIRVTGLLSAIPFAVAGVWMVVWGAHSDRKQERRWHICISVLMSVLALVGVVVSTTLTVQLVFLSLVAAGAFSALPLFWSLPPAVLAPSAAAAGIAAINAVGNFSGLIQPYFMGLSKDLTGGFEGGLLSIAICAAIATVIIWKVGRRAESHAGDEPFRDSQAKSGAA